MKDPAVEAMVQLKQRMQEWAESSMTQPKADPFEHGKQVGTYVGLQIAVAEIQNALSAGDAADAKL